jgi:hypothetical protein
VGLKPETVKILEEWVAYYQSPIGTGHSYAMLNGVVNTPNAVIVSASGLRFDNVLKRSMVRFDQPSALTGSRVPIIWDNYALVSLFSRILADVVDDEEVVALREWKSRVLPLLWEYAKTGYINDFVIRDIVDAELKEEAEEAE